MKRLCGCGGGGAAKCGTKEQERARIVESFDVFEPQDRHPSSSWVRPSGIGLG